MMTWIRLCVTAPRRTLVLFSSKIGTTKSVHGFKHVNLLQVEVNSFAWVHAICMYVCKCVESYIECETTACKQNLRYTNAINRPTIRPTIFLCLCKILTVSECRPSSGCMPFYQENVIWLRLWRIESFQLQRERERANEWEKNTGT